MRWCQQFGVLRLRTTISLVVLPLFPILVPIAPLPGQSTISTKAGESRTVSLESGSAVYLNERTSVTIAHDWSGYTVQVLNGEAVFDIRHNMQRRISVTVGSALFDHIGTRFAVQRSADDASVSVLEGLLAVKSIPIDPRYATQPHHRPTPGELLEAETLAIAQAGTQVRIHGLRAEATFEYGSRPIAELERETAWTKGWLTFNGETLSQVAAAFNAHNVKQIVLVDASLAELRVGGRFLAGDVDSSIQSLARSMPIRVLPNPDPTDSRTILLARAHKSYGPLHPMFIPDKSPNRVGPPS
jgi:transmembrane sensor